MLAGLSIRNVVLIEQLSLGFAEGLSALTGETGAGKSILLDALGSRPRRPQRIRAGAARSGHRDRQRRSGRRRAPRSCTRRPTSTPAPRTTRRSCRRSSARARHRAGVHPVRATRWRAHRLAEGAPATRAWILSYIGYVPGLLEAQPAVAQTMEGTYASASCSRAAARRRADPRRPRRRGPRSSSSGTARRSATATADLYLQMLDAAPAAIRRRCTTSSTAASPTRACPTASATGEWPELETVAAACVRDDEGRGWQVQRRAALRLAREHRDRLRRTLLGSDTSSAYVEKFLTLASSGAVSGAIYSLIAVGLVLTYHRDAYLQPRLRGDRLHDRLRLLPAPHQPRLADRAGRAGAGADVRPGARVAVSTA